MADTIKTEIPYFQTPNSIFDLDIEVNVKQTKKNGDKKQTIIVKRSMKPQEKLVYIYFCRCGNNGGQIFPSYNKIAHKCGISRRTAIDAVEVLKSNNFIIKNYKQKVNSNEQDVNEYFLLNPKKALLSSAGDAPPSAEGALPVVQEMHHPSAGDAPKKEPIKKNHIKYTPQFLEWYELYPNQWNKEQSFKNFQKLLKQGETYENIMLATKNYIAYLKHRGTVDKQYIVRSTNFTGNKKDYLGYLNMDVEEDEEQSSNLKTIENWGKAE
jgi:hypothetical protein